MHELSMALAMVEQVEQILSREHAGAVRSITVDIGALSGVDRAAFEFAYPLAIEGTPLAAAALVIVETPAEVTCEACGERTRPAAFNLCCATCGSHRVRISAGRDLLIHSLECEGE